MNPRPDMSKTEGEPVSGQIGRDECRPLYIQPRVPDPETQCDRSLAEWAASPFRYDIWRRAWNKVRYNFQKMRRSEEDAHAAFLFAWEWWMQRPKHKKSATCWPHNIWWVANGRYHSARGRGVWPRMRNHDTNDERIRELKPPASRLVEDQDAEAVYRGIVQRHYPMLWRDVLTGINVPHDYALIMSDPIESQDRELKEFRSDVEFLIRERRVPWSVAGKTWLEAAAWLYVESPDFRQNPGLVTAMAQFIAVRNLCQNGESEKYAVAFSLYLWMDSVELARRESGLPKNGYYCGKITDFANRVLAAAEDIQREYEADCLAARDDPDLIDPMVGLLLDVLHTSVH